MRVLFHPTLCSHAHKVLGVQLYKNNAHALLLRILSIVSSDWLQRACSVGGVCECGIIMGLFQTLGTTSPLFHG